jgi:hypothetical protein
VTIRNFARTAVRRVVECIKGSRTVIWWALVSGATIGVVLVVIALPVDLVGMRHMSLTPKDRLDAEGGLRSSLIQLIGGVVLIAGLYFTSRSFALTREGHLTDRYAKAIEQIGNENGDVRIGGIYALERIARDSDVDRMTTVEVLSSLIREHTRQSPDLPKVDNVEADVQAAITVLGRRSKAEAEDSRLDLYF